MIELRKITKRFGSAGPGGGDFSRHLKATSEPNATTAVDRVDLQVGAGEFVTLLGPSGCGKTTLLRMISGFEQPDEGRVLLDGVDVTNLPPYRRDVNQVFQSYALFPHLSVRDNIGFGPSIAKIDRRERQKRIEEALALVSLTGLETRKPNQLSGGQKQRVALARAVINRPKVLLLDEPLAALDAKLRQSMQVELKQIQQHLGITFVFVTHDQEEALVMSDRVAVMNAGRVEQLGTPSEVYHRPTTRFVASFIGQMNWITAAERGEQGETLAVRPEQFSIGSEPAERSIRCTVLQRIFRGERTQLIVQTESGSQWIVAGEVEIGTTVHLTVRGGVPFP